MLILATAATVVRAVTGVGRRGRDDERGHTINGKMGVEMKESRVCVEDRACTRRWPHPAHSLQTAHRHRPGTTQLIPILFEYFHCEVSPKSYSLPAN